MDTRQEEKKQKVVLGLDLTNDYAQISYFFLNQDEPDTLKAFQGEKYNIPVCLLKKYGVNQWYYGEQAQKGKKENKGVFLTNLLKLAHDEKQISVDGTEVKTVALLSLFVKKCLSMLGILIQGFFVEAFMITVDNFTEKTAEIMKELKKELPYESERIYVQSHEESLFYYIVNQEKELWSRDVAVFEFLEGRLYSYLFTLNRKTTPHVAMIQREEYPQFVISKDTDFMSDSLENDKRLDEKFLKLLEEFTRGKLISTVYLIGSGFEKEWYKESLAFLCRTRRIFGGNNLYSKGACYSAREKKDPGYVSGKYLFLGNDKLKYNIGVMAVRGEEACVIPLLDAGVNWYEVKAERDFFIDEGDALELVVTSMYGQENTFQMNLDGLPKRPKKITRLRLQLTMENEHHLRIQVKDMGFGNFFLSSGKVWNGIIEV